MSAFDFAPLQAPVPEPVIDTDAVLAAARLEAEAIRAAAREEGFAAGHDDALAGLAPALTPLEEGAQAAHAELVATADRLEGEAVELAFALAEKVLAAKVAVDSGAVLEAVRGALRGLVDRERITVLVNPAELDLVRAAREELVVSLGGVEHCEIQSERRVGAGGAIVRHPDGQIDARIETKLERAREVVEATLRDGAPSSSEAGLP